jgi:hypothetical protein
MSNLKLERRKDSIFATSESLPEAVEVVLVYARPISARDRQISVLSAKKRKEVAWIDSLAELDASSRAIAEEALYDRYRISIVESVEHSFVNHGHRYLKVQTDRGFRYFNLKEPGKNVTHLSEDHLVIRDSMGNRYEIKSLQALDPESRERLELVL